MINKIKSNLRLTEDTLKLLSNFFSLSILQALNLILPLITLPYLVRVLGIELYGVLVFSIAIIAYLGVVVDYGFNITATRAISVNRDTHEKVVEIVSAVLVIKLFLVLFGFLLLIGLVLVFDKFTEYWQLYLLTYLVLFGQALFPVWFFQGMEKMRYIAFLNILSKSIFAAAIFLFVQEQSDIYLIPLLTAFGTFVAAIWSLLIMRNSFGVSFHWQSFKALKQYIHEGWYIFLTNLSGNLYGQGNIVILGLFTSPTIVGFYSLAQKLSGVVISVFQVLTQTVMPYFSRLKEQNYLEFNRIFKKIILYAGYVNAFLIGLVFLFSDLIYKLVTGIDDDNAFFMFKFWLLIAFITIFNVLFNPVVIALKQDKNLSKLYMLVGVLFIILGSWFTYEYSYEGILYSMLVVETVIFITSVFIIKAGLRDCMLNKIAHK